MAKKYTVVSPVRYEGVLHREGSELTLEDKETSGIEHCLKAAKATTAADKAAAEKAAAEKAAAEEQAKADAEKAAAGKK